MLMSDLLLLTRPDTHDRLVVTEDPIMLQDVISHDFTRQHRKCTSNMDLLLLIYLSSEGTKKLMLGSM